MTGLVVLVTGVTRFIGSELAGRLAEQPGVARVIGVDATLPEPAARSRMGGAEFARADIRNPLISRVIDAARVDTVVHASASATPASSAPAAGQGDERPRHHAAAGRLPALGQRAEPDRAVDRRGLRRVVARPGDLHRGDPRGRCRVGAGPGRHRHRGLRPRLRPPPARRPGRRAAVRRGHRPDRGDAADPVFRAVARSSRRRSAGTPGCSWCTRSDAVGVLEHLAVGRLRRHGQRRR